MTENKQNLLVEANTQDFNDMRAMLTEIEQTLLGVDPTRQMRFYQTLQNRLYDMLEDARNHENILLYPDETTQNVCLN